MILQFMDSFLIRICFMLYVAFLQVNLFPQVEKTGSIYVEITNIRNDKGDVKVSLYDQKDGFPGNHEKAVANIIADIPGITVTAVFDSIPYGEYAIGILHDENNNFIMDSNWIGIPKEGFGASNDAPARMGPPKYNDAKFDLIKPELRLKIQMAYF